MKHHNGTGLFVECERGQAIIYEGVRVNVLSDLYTDRFGNNADDEKRLYFKMSNFILNRTCFNNLKNELLDFKLTEKTFSYIRKRQSYYTNTYY